MRTKIIAEVASNHGGDMKLATEFIRKGAAAGVDYVKFQSWQAKGMSPKDPQYDWFKKSELTDDQHGELKAQCEKNGIGFLTTIFHADRVGFLQKLTPKILKVGSADTMNLPLLEALDGKFEHLLISTGMATDAEIEKLSKIIKKSTLTLFHSVSLYPTPIEQANLKRMDFLRKYSSSIGYSDHTVGTDAIKMAIDREAHFVEKHFCLSRQGPGRVCDWDASPEMFKEIVDHAKKVDLMMGSGSFKKSEAIDEARKRFIGRFDHKET
jgi:N,N'-diacetyllegionaminate synthase